MAENAEMPTVVEIIQVHQEPLTDVQFYAFERVSEVWDRSQWYAFNRIVEKESGWLETAQNPESTAYGKMQFLDSTWELVGCEKTSDPYKQIDCGILYIEDRYSNPQLALDFHLRMGWY